MRLFSTTVTATTVSSCSQPVGLAMALSQSSSQQPSAAAASAAAASTAASASTTTAATTDDANTIVVGGRRFARNKWMSHEPMISMPSLSTSVVHSLLVISAALIIGLFQLGKLGDDVFSYQLLCFLLSLCILGYLFRLKLDGGPDFFAPSNHNVWLRMTVAVVWVITIGAPVMYYAILELFTGHRRPDAQWYEALWRICVILILWFAFAIFNEKYARPYWRQVAVQQVIAARQSQQQQGQQQQQQPRVQQRESVAVQGMRLAEQEREEALERIQARRGLLSRRKRRLEQKVIKAQAEIKELTPTDDNDDGEDEERMAVLEEKKGQLEEFTDDLADVTDQLKLLQQDWLEAQHLDKYKKFYR